jgi:leucyl/phenylalanyl-tRNA--protein transferase
MKLFAEQRKSFPDPQGASVDGIVDLSDDLRVERLLEAYSFWIFPWPHQDLPTLWFSPQERGILQFNDFHIPRSLQKIMARGEHRFTFNQQFDLVIEACARMPRPGQDGTWITDHLLRAYRDFHRAGYAHSLEVWRGSDLVGGLYGVYVGGLFCGESMFYLQPNASKLAIVYLVEFLRSRSLTWMDTQMVTPVLEALGGKYIPRAEFLQRLEETKLNAQEINFI